THETKLQRHRRVGPWRPGHFLWLARLRPARLRSALGPSERKDAVRGRVPLRGGSADDLACPRGGTGCQLVTEERLPPFAVVLRLGVFREPFPPRFSGPIGETHLPSGTSPMRERSRWYGSC